jgi:predicted lipoprotein with Yx(FWY)xxD motif
MFSKLFVVTALLGVVTLAACGGGSSGSAGGGPYGPPGSTPPPQSSNMPTQQTVGGKPAFVNPSNNFTLYFLDVDTPSGGACTGGCLSVWLVLKPSNGAKAQNGFTIVNRSDGTGMQWDYKNHPLYNFTGDSGPEQSNGNGLPFAGGHWHIARPT